ncbi:YfhO family protein, partial [Aureispira]|nr:YfhO family protein [Aureispira sp.]
YFEQALGPNSFYLLLGLLSFMALIVYGSFWFTDNIFLFKDIGSDSINVFYPNYYWNAATWEQEGVFPSWSFATGLGQDIMLGSKGDPFVWLLYLAGKDSIIEGLAYIEALKVVLSGMCFYAYLRTMRIAYLASVCGGLIFAFSGFMILGSGWFVFTIEGLYFSMMLFAFERYLLLGKWGMFPVVLMLVSISQPLDVYIMGLLIGTYGTVRILLVNDFNWKDLGIKYLQLLGLGALALAMGAILFLPSIDLMLNSPRVLGESNFFEVLQSKAIFDWVDPNLWATTKARLFSTNLLVDNTAVFKGAMNYLEAPAIYCGLGTLILVPQAFVFFTKKERILYGSLLGLYLLPLFLPYLRYTFWLFAGDYFRLYSLFVIFIMLFLSIKSIHFIYKEQRFSWIGLGVGTIGAFYLLFSVVNTEVVLVNESTRSFLYLLLFLNVIIIAAWSVKAFRPICSIAFLALLCIDLISVAKPTLNERSIATASEFTTEKVGYNDYTIDAVNWIKSVDPSFYRVEKFQYHSGLAIHGSINDAKVQGYMGSQSYHSFNQLNYIRFLGALNVIDQTNEYETRWAPGVGSRQLLTMLVSNKYILTKTEPQKPVGVGYTFLKTIGDVSIFQNQHFLPFGFTYDKMILRSDFDKIIDNRISKDITLLKAVVIEDDNEKIISKLEKFDTTNVKPSQYTELTLSEDVKNRKREAFEMSSFSNSSFSGSITLSKDKMLFFSMPLDKGWTAYVDNKEVEIHRVNVGFSGLMLSSGTHTIEIKYETPYFNLGKWISIFSFLFYGLFLWWGKEKNLNPESK